MERRTIPVLQSPPSPTLAARLGPAPTRLRTTRFYLLPVPLVEFMDLELPLFEDGRFIATPYLFQQWWRVYAAIQSRIVYTPQLYQLFPSLNTVFAQRELTVVDLYGAAQGQVEEISVLGLPFGEYEIIAREEERLQEVERSGLGDVIAIDYRPTLLMSLTAVTVAGMAYYTNDLFLRWWRAYIHLNGLERDRRSAPERSRTSAKERRGRVQINAQLAAVSGIAEGTEMGTGEVLRAAMQRSIKKFIGRATPDRVALLQEERATLTEIIGE